MVVKWSSKSGAATTPLVETALRTTVVNQVAFYFGLAAGYRRTTESQVSSASEAFSNFAYGMLMLVATLCGAEETARIRAEVQRRIDVPLESFRVAAFDALAEGKIDPKAAQNSTLRGFSESDLRRLFGLE